ncbi:hypothetical protein [Acinetobacter guillouiae]|uniref:hypothetical protein n=1 Tax=Acinetobacter guillouiae TaxID=106649 RepID=UPI003009CB9E
MIASKGVGVHTAENAKKVADLLEAKDKILKEKMRCGEMKKKKQIKKWKNIYKSLVVLFLEDINNGIMA